MRLKGKSRFASCAGMLLCLMALAAMLPVAPALAQDGDAAAEPAPVLRGFRLDPDRAKPEPPPPTATVPQPSETPKQSPAPTPRPQAKAPEPRATQTQEEPGEAAPQTAVPAAEPEPLPEAAVAEPPAPTATGESDNSLWWQLAAAAAALGFVLAGIWWLRRQPARKRTSEPEIAETPVTPKAAPSPPIIKPVAPKIATPAPVLLEFLPDRAVVSISNLSVTGTLRLTNQSEQPVEQLRLRVALIGASANQAEIITAFHNRDDGKEKLLDDLKPGESRKFDIEMALPLADMPSYVVGAQRLLVPIVMANLGYGNGPNAQVELAYIIGREANPPQPKLAPLRLDLGPRSFAPLGQRPLAA